MMSTEGQLVSQLVTAIASLCCHAGEGGLGVGEEVCV